MKTEILANLLGFLKEDLGVEASENTALIGDKILDSLDFMNYITTIEEKYKIKISDEDILKNQLGVVKNLVEYISSKVE